MFKGGALIAGSESESEVSSERVCELQFDGSWTGLKFVRERDTTLLPCCEH